MTDRTLREKINDLMEVYDHNGGTAFVVKEHVLALIDAHTAAQPAPPAIADAPVSDRPGPDAVAEAWQAMDTAPTDGTKFVATNGRLTFTTYSQQYYEKFPYEKGGPTYKSRWTAEDDSSVWPWSPTHWMPLPAAKGQQP